MKFDRSLTQLSASMRLYASASASSLFIAGIALADPSNPTVITGDVSISGLGTGNVLVVNDSLRSVVDWESFSIGTGETTTFDQLTNDSAILNRVTGGDITEIYGSLTSNGQVYLINQNGIAIGESGLVDTNGFVASTLDVSNSDFLAAGEMIFGNGVDVGGGITVEGRVRSVSGGDIFLLSREIDITETAQIESQGGTIGFGAGEEILLRPVDSGNGRISIRAGSGRINNAGSVEAAVAELKAAGGNEYALAINNTGVIRATGYSTSGGRVTLGGGGTVRNAGTVSATKRVRVSSKTRVQNSGTVRAAGGDIIFEAPQITVEAGSLLDVSAAMGGGRVFIGGGYMGGTTDWDGNDIGVIETAQSVHIEAETAIDTSATLTDAGDVVIWSDGTTTMLGDIVASTLSGQGGDIEISGAQLTVESYHNYERAGSLGAGTLLFDPVDVTILGGSGAAIVNTFYANDIAASLAVGDVTIVTTGAGGSGDITFDTVTNGDITIAWNSTGNIAGTFALHADRDILTTGAGNLAIVHTNNYADSDATPGVSAGDTFVNASHGISFRAARDITIGSATEAQDIVIGSEFGETEISAGDTNFDGTTDAAGTVTIQSAGGSTQIGFSTELARTLGLVPPSLNRSDSERDRANANVNDNRAANGEINISGQHINVMANIAENTFVQIGHGGAELSSSWNDYDIANSDINLTADTGDITINASANSFAQVGHGWYSFDNLGVAGNGLQTGDISGNITLDAFGDITVASTLDVVSTDSFSTYSARVGHGSTAVFEGSALPGVEYSFGRIAGRVQVNAGDQLFLGSDLTLTAAHNAVGMRSQIGHGNVVLGVVDNGLVNAQDINIVAGDIGNFEDITGAQLGGIISVNSEFGVTVGGEVTDQNGSDVGFIAQRLGHGNTVNIAASVASGAGVSITEGFIAGQVVLVQNQEGSNAAEQILVISGITNSTTANSDTAMLSVIGHGSDIVAETGNGTTAFPNDGGDFFYQEADILGSSVTVITNADTTDNPDYNNIVVGSYVESSNVASDGVNAFAQIGHGSNLQVSTGNGSALANQNAGAGGNVSIVRGSVWDGFVVYNENTDDQYTLGGFADSVISIQSANRVIVDSEVSSGTASMDHGVAEARIGVGGLYVVNTGNGAGGGTSNDGGRGGDILITGSQTPVFHGITNGSGDYLSTDVAEGIHMDIFIDADSTSTDRNLEITSDVSTGNGGTDRSLARSNVGHGDTMRLVTGNGANGGSGSMDTADGGDGGDISVLLGSMHIQGDITAEIAGGVLIDSSVDNSGNDDVNDSQSASVLGHGGFAFAHAGDGGDGRSTGVFVTDSAVGGEGGLVALELAAISNRDSGAEVVSGDDTEGAGADISILITSAGMDTDTVVVSALVGDAARQGSANQVNSVIGHNPHAVAIGGIGGVGSSIENGTYSSTEGDTHVNGGDGGVVVINQGFVRGDISIAGTSTNALQQVHVNSQAGGDTMSLATANIGHLVSLAGFAQNGGDAGDIAAASGGVTIDNSPYADVVTLLDLNDDDAFNLTGVNDAGSTEDEDGIDIDFETLVTNLGGTATTEPNADGVAETFGTITTHVGDGSALVGQPSGTTALGAILFDVDGNPSYILDDSGNFVENTALNYATYIGGGAGSAAASNASFFNQNIGGYFVQDLNGTNSNGYDNVLGVDINHDGAIDFVDFDLDGQIDIVDIDMDGEYDQLDGRSNFSTSSDALALLDYAHFTDEAVDVSHLEGGWSLLEDFNLANGGDGGDVTLQSGFVDGDITLNIGQSSADDPSLLVESTQVDTLNDGGDEFAVSRVGHMQAAIGSTSGTPQWALAGTGETSVDAADGGDGGEHATVANGGDGGSVSIIQGSEWFETGTTPSGTDIRAISGDISITGGNKVRLLTAISDGVNTSVEATIGHAVLALADASNIGGDGESVGLNGAESGGNGITEIADGGDGGSATIIQHSQMGEIDVLAGDDGTSGQDYSVEIISSLLYNANSGTNDTSSAISQIGHAFGAGATSGNGGEGDDGQKEGSGGDGGDVKIVQEEITDAEILIDTVTQGGNGIHIQSTVQQSDLSQIIARVGHMNQASASTGEGGHGAQTVTITEQFNQTATGGRGGDITVYQGAHQSDIFVEVGANTVGDYAVLIEALAPSSSVYSHVEELVVAGIGHFGTGNYSTGGGGEGGDDDGNGGVGLVEDPNARLDVDADLDPAENWQGDGSRLMLGTVRDAGRGGHINAISGATFDTSSTGSVTTVGLTHSLEADISVLAFETTTGVNDGISIYAQSGEGFNRDASLLQTVAQVGHIQLDSATAGDGGSAEVGPHSVQVSSIDGGDGGNATINQGSISGVITVSNFATQTASSMTTITGANPAGDAEQENILVTSTGTNLYDSDDHRADARIGHFVDGEVTAGNGGDGVQPRGTPTVGSYGTLSAMGGYGGDATLSLANLDGYIGVTAENSIEVLAEHVSQSGAMNVSIIGHASAGDVRAGTGATGGEAGDENVYFIYEALLEYDGYRGAGDNHATAWGKLSTLEQELIDAIVNKYFEQDGTQSADGPEKDISEFLARLVQGERDNDIMNALLDGNADGASSLTGEDIETLTMLMGASGDGGDARLTSGAISGGFGVTARALDTTDTTRGILVHAVDAVLTGAAQVAQIGHHTEVREVVAGDAGGIRAYGDQMGGDGGSIYVTQGELSGDLNLYSSHMIRVLAEDTGLGPSDGTNARVGHHATIGSDRINYRPTNILQAGNGGSELSNLSDGYNGSGGFVSIRQLGANGNISLTADRADDDEDSILIEANDTASAGDVEVHIGHNLNIGAVMAGNAGQQHALHSPVGLQGGVREGNGGDIGVTMGAVMGDITLTARRDLQLRIGASDVSGDARILIGHERDMGERRENAQLVAGFGGDSISEDVNITNLTEIVFNGVGDADGGNIDFFTSTMSGDISLISLGGDVRVEIDGGSGASTDVIDIGHIQTADLVAGEGGLYRGITQGTAGEGGAIRAISLGAISGDIALTADRDGTGTNRRVILSSSAAAGGETIQVGHGYSHMGVTGSAGFGVTLPTADLETRLNDFVLLDELGAGAGDTFADRQAEVTLGLANEILQLIQQAGSIAQLSTNSEYEDRYSEADWTTISAARDLIVTAWTNALTDMGSDNAANMQSYAATVSAQLAILRAIVGEDQISDPAASGGVSQVTQTVSGNVTLTADAMDGIIELTGSGVSGGSAFINLGHVGDEDYTTELAGGETDGGPPEGGVSGDGGGIVTSHSITGNVTLSADLIAAEVTNSAGELNVHLGHTALISANAGRSDIGDKIANGGPVYVVQSVMGSVNLVANHYSSDDSSVDAILGTGGAGDNLLYLGHLTSVEASSDADDGVGGSTSEANRGGDIVVTQIVDSPVTISVDLDADSNPNDLILQSGGAGGSVFVIGSQNFAQGNSGGSMEDGDSVTITQSVTGALSVIGTEDLTIETAGAGQNVMAITHVARAEATSGLIDHAAGSLGGVVDVDQTIDAAININAARDFVFSNGSSSGDSVLNVGHVASVAAATAGDSDDPVDTLVDLDADQTVGGDLTITASSISVSSSGAAHETRLGHSMERELEADGSESHIGGATSTLTGNISLTATGVDTDTSADATSVPGLSDTDLLVVNNTDAGSIEIGHTSESDVNGTATVADGSAIATQQIGGSVSLTSADQMLIQNGAAGTIQVGHDIVETADLATNALDTTVAGGGTSMLTQTISDMASVTVTSQDSMLINQTGSGMIQIGHASPATNASQEDGTTIITVQTIMGDIAVQAGLAETAANDGTIGPAGDDLRIMSATANGVRIGHDHTDVSETSGNTTQTVDADILVTAGADLAVVMSAIGHAHYDFDDVAVDTSNSTVAGTTRNRIAGLTTIGAVQSVDVEGGDGRVASSMLFQDAEINSGYSDAGGELRFFTASRENVDVPGATKFNDHGTGDTAETRAGGGGGNIFAADGGNSHEEPFELLSTTAAYTATAAGLGNFVFYFTPDEVPPEIDITLFTNIFDLPQVGLIFEGLGDGPLNMNGVQEFLGSSTFEQLCVANGLSASDCDAIGQQIGELPNLPGASRDQIDGFTVGIAPLSFGSAPVSYSAELAQTATVSELEIGADTLSGNYGDSVIDEDILQVLAAQSQIDPVLATPSGVAVQG